MLLTQSFKANEKSGYYIGHCFKSQIFMCKYTFEVSEVLFHQSYLTGEDYTITTREFQKIHIHYFCYKAYNESF